MGCPSHADGAKPSVTQRSLIHVVLTQCVDAHTQACLLQSTCHVHQLLLGAPEL